jgi:hypothetical protein
VTTLAGQSINGSQAPVIVSKTNFRIASFVPRVNVFGQGRVAALVAIPRNSNGQGTAPIARCAAALLATRLTTTRLFAPAPVILWNLVLTTTFVLLDKMRENATCLS